MDEYSSVSDINGQARTISPVSAVIPAGFKKRICGRATLLHDILRRNIAYAKIALRRSSDFAAKYKKVADACLSRRPPVSLRRGGREPLRCYFIPPVAYCQ